MGFGICLQSVIPVRIEPTHKSEMVTQVLFGELYSVIEIRIIGSEYSSPMIIMKDGLIRNNPFPLMKRNTSVLLMQRHRYL